MALQWDWNKKIGELIVDLPCEGKGYGKRNDFTINLYEGNALLIMLHEYKSDTGKDMYDMYMFFVDKTHAKKCLGLQKNGDGELVNILNDGWNNAKKLRINKAKSRNWKEIVTLFSQAFDNFIIEFYTEESEG